MIEYIYRGFKLSYKIDSAHHENKLYKATGHATCLLDNPASCTPARFQTEYNSHDSTEHEIRSMLENYVNFELKNYFEMK